MTVFLANVDRILAGDILLTRHVEGAERGDAKRSRAIALVSGGRFSHAMICSSPPAFVEAIGSGVSIISLGRSFVHDLKNVRLLRHPDRSAAGGAARLAQLEVGRDYSVLKAVGSVFHSKTLRSIRDDHGIFCSALVAQVYENAGCALSGTPVERTTPATIEKAPHLEDVTASVFREALAPNNISTMSALDGDRVPTASARQTEISSRCAKAFFDRADTLAGSLSRMGLVVTPSFYGLLDFVRRAVERIDEMAPAERSALTDIDLALAAFIEQGEMSGMLRDVMTGDDAEITRNIAQSFEAEPDIDVGAMRKYLKVSREQLADRRKSIRSLVEWGPGRSAAMRAYLPIDVSSADAIERRIGALEEVLRRLGRARPALDGAPPIIAGGAES